MWCVGPSAPDCALHSVQFESNVVRSQTHEQQRKHGYRIYKKRRTEPGKRKVEEDLDTYLDEAVSPPSTDVLVYWSKNQVRFPPLAAAARKYLAISGRFGILC